MAQGLYMHQRTASLSVSRVEFRQENAKLRFVVNRQVVRQARFDVVGVGSQIGQPTHRPA